MTKGIKPAVLLRAIWFCLAAAAVWSVWSSALAQTNALSTNSPAGRLVQGFNLLDRQFIEDHKSELSFGLDRIEVLKTLFLGEPLWQYIASAIYLALAFYSSRVVDWFVKTRLKTWAERTETKWDDVLTGLADGPVKVLVFVLLFHVGLEVFDWPAWLELWLSRLTLLLLAVSIVMVSLRAVDAAVVIWKDNIKADSDHDFNEHFLVLIGKVIKGTILLVAGLMLLDNLHVNITALLGSVSVLGLALGLAAQDTVSNLFGAVAVFIDKPFRVGDRIKVGDVDGTVEGMGLRATRVRTADGFLVTVPNKTVGANTITNVSRRTAIRTALNIGLTYDTSAERVKEAIAILESIYKSHPLTRDVLITFNQFADSSLNLDIVWQCKSTDWTQYTRALQEINLTIKQRFDDEKLDFAFPTQTVIHQQAAAAPGGAPVTPPPTAPPRT